MNVPPRRTVSDALRALDAYEVALRSLAIVDEVARWAVQEAQPRNPEMTAELLGLMQQCDAAGLIDCLVELKHSLAADS
jgi:hypothetical protein